MSTIPATGALVALIAVATLPAWNVGLRPPSVDWPQFRGPGGLGVVEGAGVVTAWGETENILWKTEIRGRGHSSPVVWGDRIFLTTATEGEVIPGAAAPTHYIGGSVFKHPQAAGADRSHTLEVVALDRWSGALVWSRVAYEGRIYDDHVQSSSVASATPVTDGRLVFFYFGSEGIYAYYFDGNLAWQANLGDFSYFGVGLGTSPVLYQDVLILQIDEGDGEGSFIIGLDKATGAEKWRTRRAVEASWGTPLLLEDVDGAAQLITVGNQLLIAYDPLTGAESWRLDGLHNNAVHSPVWNGELVFVSSGYPRSVVRGVRPGAGAAEVVWEYRKGAAYVASNVAYGSHLYVTNDKGTITCLDAATGEVVYEGGRVPVPPSMLMSSLLVVDGSIMMSTPEGDTFWIATGDQFSVTGHNSLDEPIWATPAIVDGTIYLRGQRHLYAIGRGDDAY